MAKRLFLIGMVGFLLCTPYTFFPERPHWYQLNWSIMAPQEAVVEAGYLAGSPCAGRPVSPTCPDRSYGWQQREHDGILSPEASGGGPGGGDSSGASGGDSGGSSGGDSGTGSK